MRLISKYSGVLLLVVAIYNLLYIIYYKKYFFRTYDAVYKKESSITYQVNWNNYISPQGRNRSIRIVGDEFILDNRRLRIIAGSFHYFRAPSENWRDILRKMKAAGLNAVSTYVEWSSHETEEKEYKFSGDHDVAKFVQMAAQEGLLVLLRPGPYICAERDLGGLPYWLLSKYPRIKLRTTDIDFMKEVEIWFKKLFSYISPLLYGNGGPIILVQIENEYGSYGHNREYKEQLRDMMMEYVQQQALFYTTDWPWAESILAGAVSGALATVDFSAVDDVKNTFQHLRKIMPQGPLMVSELYTGWITHWGEKMSQVSTDKLVHCLNKLIENNASLNFYVFFGGTNFEFSSGANFGDSYLPLITSYDYDAPLDETGDPTPKYYAIHEALSKINEEVKTVALPKQSPKGNYGKIRLNYHLNLLSSEGRQQIGKVYEDVQGAALPTFEQLRQRAGLLLFETTLNYTDGQLVVSKPRDWVYVFVDGEMKGILSRMNKMYTLRLTCKRGAILSLLVENHGRINFDTSLQDFKGIRSSVKFNYKVLNGTWKITGYPLEVLNLKNSEQKQKSKAGPAIFQAEFTLPYKQKHLDTWINTRGWRKGYVWINGHNLGRYWPALGPQVTLYVPSVWLHVPPRANLVQVLELEEAHPNITIEFIDHKILQHETYVFDQKATEQDFKCVMVYDPEHPHFGSLSSESLTIQAQNNIVL